MDNCERDYKATFYQAISGVMKRSQEIAHSEYKIDYIAIDNGFMSYYYSYKRSDFAQLYRWMEGVLKEFSDMEIEVAEFSPYRYHRIITIPKPESITNPWYRKEFQNAVKIVIHYHLFYGVSCYLIFIDPKDYLKSNIFKDDIITFTNGLTYDCSKIYSLKSFSGFREVSKSDSTSFVRKYFTQINANDFNSSIHLFYDAKTFDNRRRNDKRWEELRRFLYQLYAGKCEGPDCKKALKFEETHLDHIVPIGLGDNQLINLQLLCCI